MGEKDQREIFATNLNRLLQDRGLTQLEVSKVIGVSAQTFNTWCRGVAIPRMDKIQRLADYFRVNKSDLIDYHGDSPATESSQADALFIEKYGQEVYDAAMTFGRLDAVDQAKVTERMDMLLEDDKYKVAGSYGEKVI